MLDDLFDISGIFHELNEFSFTVFLGSTTSNIRTCQTFVVPLGVGLGVLLTKAFNSKQIILMALTVMAATCYSFYWGTKVFHINVVLVICSGCSGVLAFVGLYMLIKIGGGNNRGRYTALYLALYLWFCYIVTKTVRFILNPLNNPPSFITGRHDMNFAVLYPFDIAIKVPIIFLAYGLLLTIMILVVWFNLSTHCRSHRLTTGH